jgi:hypothetical protein
LSTPQEFVRRAIARAVLDKIMSKEKSPPEANGERTASNGSMVFVSHDTRDALIAEAFSKLLGSVSAGVLKSFRSSDKKGKQGIEYGVEWYPEIMGKLEEASDVVCLLTPFSVGRPWILYEAGVAKGKLDTPVHGLALGVPLSEASTGPFAQFQNCDDDEESITSLVMQLVGKIPHAEPDREVVETQVRLFKKKVSDIFSSQGHEEEKVKSKVGNSVIAKQFEEIKVMFQDLPSRVEGRISDSMPPSRFSKRRRRFHPMMIDELMHFSEFEADHAIALLIILSPFRDEFPWLYDICTQIYFASEEGDYKKLNGLLASLDRIARIPRKLPVFEDILMESKDGHILMMELPRFIERFSSRMREQMKVPRKGRLKNDGGVE